MIETPKNLTRNILFGMLLGFAVGSIIYYTNIFGDTLSNIVEVYAFKLGSDIFINLLKMLIVPLVFFSLVSGISSLGNLKSIGNISLKTITLYLITTAIAVSLSLFIGAIFQPGSGVNTANLISPDKLPQGQGIYQTILDIFPANIIEAMANNQMLAIVFFSIIFGLALNKTNHLTNNLSESFEKLNTVFMQLVVMIIAFAPIGVFCLIGKFVIADGLNVFGEALKYVILLIATLFLHTFITYSVLIKFFTRLSLKTFFLKMKDVAVFAFSTSSSAATIPVTLKTVENELGVNKNVAAFVVPVGATINMDGTAIMQGCATFFLAAYYGINLDFSDILTIIFTATIASIGTAGIPSAGIIMLSLILVEIGIPTEGIALLLGVDRLLDMIRTSVNVAGDTCITCIIASSENLIDNDKYHSV